MQVIEQKLDGLAVSVNARFEQVDARFAQVDRRFDEVGAAIAEQRAYIEFVYEKRDQKIDTGFAKVDGRFAQLERKIDQIIDLHAPRTPPNESSAG